MISLEERIRRGREAIRKAQVEGQDVTEWIEHLRQLESDLWESHEITRLMQEHGFALVWSDTLGETIAFARDDVAAAQVPGGIVAYTRSELEQIVGKGRDASMLKLIHESKKHGGKVRS